MLTSVHTHQRLFYGFHFTLRMYRTAAAWQQEPLLIWKGISFSKRKHQPAAFAFTRSHILLCAIKGTCRNDVCFGPKNIEAISYCVLPTHTINCTHRVEHRIFRKTRKAAKPLHWRICLCVFFYEESDVISGRPQDAERVGLNFSPMFSKWQEEQFRVHVWGVKKVLVIFMCIASWA